MEGGEYDRVVGVGEERKMLEDINFSMYRPRSVQDELGEYVN